MALDMKQLENHMVLPHPTPSEYETEDYEINNTILLEAWDRFASINRADLDYLEKSKRYQGDPDLFNMDSMSPLEYSSLVESVDKRIETFDFLYSKASSFEYLGMDTDLTVLVFQWWLSL